MVYILYTFFSDEFGPQMFDYYMGQIPAEMQKKIRKYKRWEDAQACLLGKNLLIRGLKKFGIHKAALQNIQYTNYMRPYFANHIHFNISHSGNCVVCAISSDFELGIDVEEIRPIELSDFEGQFSEAEMLNICKSDDKLFSFYDLWTKKEAVMKADGRGINIPLKNVIISDSTEVVLQERKWYVKQIDFDNMYCINIATAGFIDNNLQIEKLSF